MRNAYLLTIFASNEFFRVRERTRKGITPPPSPVHSRVKIGVEVTMAIFVCLTAMFGNLLVVYVHAAVVLIHFTSFATELFTRSFEFALVLSKELLKSKPPQSLPI